MLKPYIPRWMQLELRRRYAAVLRQKHASTWPIDERAVGLPEAWFGWPHGKKFALVLTHDVDTTKGHGRCLDLMELEKGLGFLASFNFVPKRYDVSPDLRRVLVKNSFEVGVHGLYHDGKYLKSKKIFSERAVQINRYLRDWNAVGYRSPSMLHNLEWFHELDIEYDSSTFDTDPFEPKPDGMQTIFPFWFCHDGNRRGYVELPYTLPQDFTLFILMQECDNRIWKKKLHWIAENGGMALLNSHPDYMHFGSGRRSREEYPANHYADFLKYVKKEYAGQYWHALPRDVAQFWKQHYCLTRGE